MKRTRAAALLCALAVLAASCSRSDDKATSSGSSSSSGSSTSAASSAADATTLAAGGFGDLATVCSKGSGEANTPSDKGVTATDIHIGTVTDKGADARPELNREMYDTAVAFAKWCNEKGGINGRQLVIDDRDAKLFEYPARVAESCDIDLALVGGGAAVDADNGARVACGLPNIPGYVVDPTARVADLQVQPVPNPVYTLQVGQYRALDKLVPGATKAYGVMVAPLPAVLVVRDAAKEGIGLVGGTVVYDGQYNVIGESNWEPFVQDLKGKGVKLFEFVGEPTNLGLLQDQMAVSGYSPDLTILTPNFYDQKYLAEHGKNAKNTYIRTSFTPLEMASSNKATKDYLDLMAQYNPSGKIAILGQQGLSALLLFATAAKACGANLTRACLLENAKDEHKWTGGGLHAPDDPGANIPSACFALIKVDGTAFTYDKAATAPTEGIFNCDPTNLVQLKNDYGVPR